LPAHSRSHRIQLARADRPTIVSLCGYSLGSWEAAATRRLPCPLHVVGCQIYVTLSVILDLQENSRVCAKPVRCVELNLGKVSRRSCVKSFIILYKSVVVRQGSVWSDLYRQLCKMALGGCYTCLKYLMFVFNFIFWVRMTALWNM